MYLTIHHEKVGPEEYTFDGMTVTDGKHGYDLEVDFNVVFDKEYYLLYVVYSTGDSEKTEHGCIDIIELFHSYDLAEDNLKEIIKHDKLQTDYERSCRGEMEKPKPLMITLDNFPKEYQLNPKWYGYFENLTYAEIVPLRLSRKRRMMKEY